MVTKRCKTILSDMSFLSYEKHNNGSCYFFCEHFPRRNIARRSLIKEKFRESKYCKHCKLSYECICQIRRLING